MPHDIICKIDDEAFNGQLFNEFGKTKDDLDEFVNIIRDWTKTQPHFPEEPNYCILQFVVLTNKFSIEKAKQKLDMYYTIRSLIPEFFAKQPLSSDLVSHSRVVYFVPLPKTTSDLKRIVYLQVNPNYGPDFFNHELVVQHIVNVFELMVMIGDNCYGYHVICDCIGIQAGFITKFSPMVHKKGMVILEKMLSNRVACIQLVNFSKSLETFLNTVIKPFLSPKLKNRVKIHNNSDILLEVYGKSRMPKDIGGEEKSLNELNDGILRKFGEMKERFEVLGTLRVDESLRPQTLVNDEVLGYFGNFKKINVD